MSSRFPKQKKNKLRFISRKKLIILVGVLTDILLVSFIAKHLVEKRLESIVRAKVQNVSQRYGQPIDFLALKLRPYGVVLESVTAGNDSLIAMDTLEVHLNLNPFSSNFLTISSLDINQFVVTAELDQLLGMLALASDRSQINKVGDSSAKSSLPKSIPQELNISSGKIQLKKSGQITSSISPVSFYLNFSDPKQPRIKLSYDEIDGSHLSELDIQVHEKGKKIALNLKGSRFPEPILNLVPLLKGSPQISGNAEIIRFDRDLFQYEFKSTVRQVTLDNPRLSYDPVGPVSFHVASHGSINLGKRVIVVERADFSLGEQNELHSLIFNVSSILDFKKIASEPNHIFQMALSVPENECQSLMTAVPAGLLGDLKSFQLQGKFSLGVTFYLDTQNPDATTYKFDQTNFDCKVSESPTQYAPEHLNGAFILERTLEDGSKLEIQVDPTSKSFTSLGNISKALSDTIVASEDAGFWAHKGIEVGAIEQAVKRNITEGRIAVGGSTITMQTVKNLYLSKDRNFARKFQELFLAWHLEQVLSKRRILEIYLNIIEFGPGIYGITDAARHYFGKEPSELTFKESVFLANFLPAPVGRYFNFCEGKVTANFQALMDHLLDRLLRLGRINQSTFEQARNEPLKFARPADMRREACSSKAK